MFFVFLGYYTTFCLVLYISLVLYILSCLVLYIYVKSIIVTEVTVMSPFIMYSSQNPWNFLDMEVIMIEKDDKCLSPFQLKSIRVTFFQ